MLVRDEQGRVLLCQLTYKRDWDLPGGVVEVSESPQQAVSREVAEELSIDIKAGPLLLTDWLPPWSGWDDALCLVFDGGVTSPAVLDDRCWRRGRSGPRSSARSTRCVSGAPTSRPAGSRRRSACSRWRVDVHGVRARVTTLVPMIKRWPVAERLWQLYQHACRSSAARSRRRRGPRRPAPSFFETPSCATSSSFFVRGCTPSRG